MFDLISFLLGGFFLSGMVMWISALGINSERVQNKIKTMHDKVFPKQAVIVRKKSDTDILFEEEK